jgi:uncharacterized protein YceK
MAMTSSRVMQTSILQMRMAGNEQLAEEAFQLAQGVINAITATPDNLVVTGDVGYRICARDTTGCDQAIIDLPAPLSVVPDGVLLTYEVERQAPLFAPLPFRLSEDRASSASAYSAAQFEIKANVNGTPAGLGRAGIRQGVVRRVSHDGRQ